MGCFHPEEALGSATLCHPVRPPHSYSFFPNPKLRTPFPPRGASLRGPLDNSRSARAPSGWGEKQTQAPAQRGAKPYVCKVVKDESLHLWRMNTQDLANALPGTERTTPLRGFSRDNGPAGSGQGLTNRPLRAQQSPLGLKENPLTHRDRQRRVQEGLSGSVPLMFSRDHALLASITPTPQADEPGL